MTAPTEQTETPGDRQCRCRRPTRAWEVIGPQVLGRLRASQVVMLFIAVAALLGAITTPTTAGTVGYLVTGVLLLSVLQYWSWLMGYRLLGHTYRCSAWLAWWRAVGRRQSFARLEGRGVRAPHAQGQGVVRMQRIDPKKAQGLALMFAVVIAGIGILAYLAAPRSSGAVGALMIQLVIAVSLALPGTLPATKGKAFRQWPRLYQLVGRVVMLVLFVVCAVFALTPMFGP